MMNRLISTLLLLLIVKQGMMAQRQMAIGKPSTMDKVSSEVYFIELDIPYKDRLKQYHDIQGKKLKSLQFASTIKVSFSPENSGKWSIGEQGERIWRLGLKSKEAYSIGVIFDLFHLPEGAYMYVYNADQSHVLGAFTSFNNKPGKVLPIAPVKGDAIVIEYHKPANVKEKEELQIGKVSHDFLDIYNYMLKDGQFDLSDTCNRDVMCYIDQIHPKIKNAVVRILINGGTLCTGTLVNNTSQDQRPLVLSANHCLSTEEEAESTLFYFQYESPYCNGPDALTDKTIAGSRLLSTAEKIDFTLLSMSEIPPFEYKPYYAGWSRELVDTMTYAIHHPQGDVKKLTIDSNAPIISQYSSYYVENSHWLIEEWDLATTEQGSSGGAIFDKNFRQVGTLIGGEATCTYPYNDFYTRLDVSWDYYPGDTAQLKHWLDPTSTNLMYLDGFDPYDQVYDSCDTLTNLVSNESIDPYKILSPSWGYWAGHNESGLTGFAEKFSIGTTNELTGMYINFAHLTEEGVTQPSSLIKFCIWDENTGYPGELISSKEISRRYLFAPGYNFIEFDSIIKLPANFFAGFEITYTSPFDTLGVYMTEDRGEFGVNNVYVNDAGTWKTLPEVHPDQAHASLDIKLALCKNIPTSIEEKIIEKDKITQLTLYPNPTTGKFRISLPVDPAGMVTVTMYNYLGQIIHHEVHPYYDETREFDLSGIPVGIYFITVITEDQKKYSGKFVLQE